MKVALHICCGVCAAGVAERLLSEGHEVRGYFFNPNIHPQEEYKKRLEAALKVAGEMKLVLEEGPYVPEDWLEKAEPLAGEPEGGRRCEVCYRYRLARTYQYMKDAGLDAFTTTLTVSPQKPAEVINRIGEEIGGDRFLARDFKKKAGFQRANELAGEWHLHRQDYCGCIYSKK